MKKLLLSTFLIAFGLISYAQNVNSGTTKGGIEGNNELKINLAYAIAGIPELNYERIIKDDMSVGIGIFFGLEKNRDYNFGLIPNYRVYFGGKKANGFFIEGNAAVISTENNARYVTYDPAGNTYSSFGDKTQTNFGLGAAAGAKFLTKNGFVGEVYLGAGRLFGNNSLDVYPRAGVNIGKRF